MSEMTFPHLTPARPTRDRLLSCDICYEGEHEDIIAGRADDLRPMYRDERDGVTVCRRCAESGAYLVIEAAGQEIP
jgi:hypothetical protein